MDGNIAWHARQIRSPRQMRSVLSQRFISAACHSIPSGVKVSLSVEDGEEGGCCSAHVMALTDAHSPRLSPTPDRQQKGMSDTFSSLFGQDVNICHGSPPLSAPPRSSPLCSETTPLLLAPLLSAPHHSATASCRPPWIHQSPLTAPPSVPHITKACSDESVCLGNLLWSK